MTASTNQDRYLDRDGHAIAQYVDALVHESDDLRMQAASLRLRVAEVRRRIDEARKLLDDWDEHGRRR